MNKFWNFSNDADGAAELRLDGEIASESWWGDEVTPAQFRADLAAHPGDITVWINSPGGDVIAASSIYTALKEHEGRVTVKIEALAASAASIVAMAGDEILIAPTAFLMIHRASTIALGDTDAMRQAARELDEVDESIARIYADRTGLDVDKVYRMMEAETWMNAQSALEHGFVDAILYRPADVEPDDAQLPELAARAVPRVFAAAESSQDFLRRLMASAHAAPEPDPEPAPEPDDTEAKRALALRMKLKNDYYRYM